MGVTVPAGVLMAGVLIWNGLAVASFAAAAALVSVIVRLTEHVDHGDGRDRPGGAEPAWWPEFERAFAEYVRAGDVRES